MATLTEPEWEDETPTTLTEPEWEDAAPAPRAAAPAPAPTPAPAPEEAGFIAGLGRGLIDITPGGKAAVAAIESTFSPKTYGESRKEVEERFAKTAEEAPVGTAFGRVGGLIAEPWAAGRVGATALRAAAPALAEGAGRIPMLARYLASEGAQAPLTFAQAKEEGATTGEAAGVAGISALAPAALRGVERAGGAVARGTAELVKDRGVVAKGLSLPVRGVARTAQALPSALPIGATLVGGVPESTEEATERGLMLGLGAAGTVGGLARAGLSKLQAPLPGKRERALVQTLEGKVRAPTREAAEKVASAELSVAREAENEVRTARKDRIDTERRLEDLQGRLQKASAAERSTLEGQIAKARTSVDEAAYKELGATQKRANSDFHKAVGDAHKINVRAEQLAALGTREDAALAKKLRDLDEQIAGAEASVRGEIANLHGTAFGRLLDIDRADETLAPYINSRSPLPQKWVDMLVSLKGTREKWTEPVLAPVKRYIDNPDQYIAEEIAKKTAAIRDEQRKLIALADRRVASAPNYKEIAAQEAAANEKANLTPEQIQDIAGRFGLRLSDEAMAGIAERGYSLRYQTERPTADLQIATMRAPRPGEPSRAIGEPFDVARAQQRVRDLENQLRVAPVESSRAIEEQLAAERAKMERRAAEDAVLRGSALPSAAEEGLRKAQMAQATAGPRAAEDFVPATPEEQASVERALQRGRRAVEGLEPEVRIPGEVPERPLEGLGLPSAVLGLLASKGARFNPNTLKATGGWLRSILNVSDPAQAREFLATLERGERFADPATAAVLLGRFDEILRSNIQSAAKWRNVAEKTNLTNAMLQAIAQDPEVRARLTATPAP